MLELDDLVKLASLGASGICIFGIFWTGWLLKESSNANNNLYHRSLHKYMNMVIAIAVISGVSGVANSFFKQSEINSLEEKKMALENEKNKLSTEKQILLTKAEEAKKSLGLILQSKEAYQLRNPNAELETHLKQLEGYLDSNVQ